MSDLIRGVVVAHSDLAESLVRAVGAISGVSDALHPVSNEGLGPNGLTEAISQWTQGGDTILFVDLGGGSCGLASLGLTRGNRAVACLTGVNLPMLLDFVFHRDMPLDDLVPRLLEKGRAGQQSYPPRTT